MSEFSSEFYDILAIKNGYTDKEVIENLTLDDVEQFLYSLGVNEVIKYDNYLICPTICHNALEDAESMKLYYYDENKSFHCYTQCSENFNIIELYKRYMSINHYSITYSEAINYIRNFVGAEIKVPKKEKEKKIKIKKADFITLEEKNKNVLDCFSNFYHPLWINEGIGIDAMKRFNIKFSYQQNKIIIPHYDIQGRLVGIRARAINVEDVEHGKYMPIKVGDEIYSHQLGFNLYGIGEHKGAINRTKRAIIFEAEKSVLLSETFYPGYSTAVATCGSQLNRFQINLLTKKLGVNEIILAFDKEYEDIKDPKCQAYRKKLIEKCDRYRGLAQFYYIFDEHGLIEEKDSPIDKGKEIFEELLKRKIKI